MGWKRTGKKALKGYAGMKGAKGLGKFGFVAAAGYGLYRWYQGRKQGSVGAHHASPGRA